MDANRRRIFPRTRVRGPIEACVAVLYSPFAVDFRARECAAPLKQYIAGYIDKQSSIADFLDAIDKEVRGEPVFAQGQEQPEVIEQNIILEQLDQYLKSRDVDIRKASNDEIRKVLKDAAAMPAIDASTRT